MKEKITTEEIIRRAKEVHGDKYDYSKTNYVNSKTKITIICPIHGEFQQITKNHIGNKQGCPVCGGTKRMTTEEFVEKAKEVHGNKYDYSKVDYINNKTNVCIICPVHGEFQQKPHDHLQQVFGCPKCSGLIRLTTEEFIEKSKEVINMITLK